MPSNPPISPGETRVLFVLLESAQELGLLRGLPAEQRWKEAKVSSFDTVSAASGALMWELLKELEEAQVLSGTWILERWRMIRTQVERSKALTNHPFSNQA